MTDPDLKKKLEELRQQVEELSTRVSPPPRPSASEESPPASTSNTKEPRATSSDDSGSIAKTLEHMHGLSEDLQLGELAKHLGAFMSDLGQDVKDSKPRALVGAFLAGVIAGKFISR